MTYWFTPAELAAENLPYMPTTKAGINDLAEREGWRRPDGEWPANPNGWWRKRAGRGGGYEYTPDVLNGNAKTRLLRKIKAREAPAAAPDPATLKADVVRGALWAAFEKLPQRQKDEAKRRLDALHAVERQVKLGTEKKVAMILTAHEYGVSQRTLWNWHGAVAGRPREDWLAHLRPHYAGRQAKVDCPDEAWQFLVDLYFRGARPDFEDCHRILRAKAAEEGWTLPSGRTLQRRLAKLPRTTQVYKRDGAEALKRLYPAQERDKSELRALEAVNGDTHRFDVRVRWEDGVIARPALVAFQDLHSGKILSWRIAREETALVVLLAFGDLVETYGIPEKVVLDNGRAFAGKWLSGGVPTRYRFKVKPCDPHGVFKVLGVEVYFTQPYSGQSKPIERAFRDLATGAAKDPRFDGAYTGNSPSNKPHDYGSKAVPIDIFESVIAERIDEHNARPGRRSEVCHGVLSFDQAFEASYRQNEVGWAAEHQRIQWLMASDTVTARKPNGMIEFAGNKYWHEELVEHIGQKVVLRFDPEDLHAGVFVYRLDGSLISFAACREKRGYFSAEEQHHDNRNRKQWLAAKKAMSDAEVRGAAALAGRMPKAPERAPVPETKVVRARFGRGGGSLAVAAARQEEFERSQSETLAQLGRGLQVLRLVQNDDDATG